MTSSSEEENVEKRRGGGRGKKRDEGEKAEGRAKLAAKEKKEKRTLWGPRVQDLEFRSLFPSPWR